MVAISEVKGVLPEADPHHEESHDHDDEAVGTPALVAAEAEE